MIFPQIAFFDIDGTLLEFGSRKLRPLTRQALLRLREKGCRLFLATGRAPYTLPDFQDVLFDGYLCFNGSLCFDRKGDLLYSRPMDKEAVKKVLDRAAMLDIPVMVSTAVEAAWTFCNSALEQYARISGKPIQLLEHEEDILKRDIYQLTAAAGENRENALLEEISGCRTARWRDDAVDIIPADGGKVSAMAEILNHYGIGRDESIAFGDGKNDLDMIRYAGVGIAMGNAPPAVRDAADRVAPDCSCDGVYRTLRELSFI